MKPLKNDPSTYPAITEYELADKTGEKLVATKIKNDRGLPKSRGWELNPHIAALQAAA